MAGVDATASQPKVLPALTGLHPEARGTPYLFTTDLLISSSSQKKVLAFMASERYKQKHFTH